VLDGVCDPVPMTSHATPNSTAHATSGIVVVYECDPGFTYNGSLAATITCNGVTWSEMGSQCIGEFKDLTYCKMPVLWCASELVVTVQMVGLH